MTECNFTACGKPVKAHGLCNGHNQQRLEGRPLKALRPRAATLADVCVVPRCEKPGKAHNLCSGHYLQKCEGRPLRPLIGDRDPVEVFHQSYKIDSEGCWVWQTNVNNHGYGNFLINRVLHRAHRWSYEHHVGPIPAGLVIDHLCRNRACVNPTHLEPVTAVENTMRGMAPHAVNARKTHCVHGHEFTASNTIVRHFEHGDGRECRACQRDRTQAKRAARLAYWRQVDPKLAVFCDDVEASLLLG